MANIAGGWWLWSSWLLKESCIWLHGQFLCAISFILNVCSGSCFSKYDLYFHFLLRYGQCWVFAGVVTTVCRAIGLPCRFQQSCGFKITMLAAFSTSYLDLDYPVYAELVQARHLLLLRPWHWCKLDYWQILRRGGRKCGLKLLHSWQFMYF